jgi:hypothetical protein
MKNKREDVYRVPASVYPTIHPYGQKCECEDCLELPNPYLEGGV